MMRQRKFIDVLARGVTLVELIISIAVISIGLAGILAVMVRTTSTSADPLVRHQALAIAEAYLEEILLKNFCDPDNATPCTVGNLPASAGCTVCPSSEGANARAIFDNVCDYNGRIDAGARNQNNTLIGGLEGYTVFTNVSTDDSLNGLQGANCEVLRVDVRVTGIGGTDITLSGYRTNY